jgi:hypothetical protein
MDSEETLKDWLIHMDNARPHNSGRVQKCIQASSVERLPHSARSPDPSPSDFFFGHIKGDRSDYNCESREHLFNAITETFTGVH